jgi:hypothetical protein
LSLHFPWARNADPFWSAQVTGRRGQAPVILSSSSRGTQRMKGFKARPMYRSQAKGWFGALFKTAERNSWWPQALNIETGARIERGGSCLEPTSQHILECVSGWFESSFGRMVCAP